MAHVPQHTLTDLAAKFVTDPAAGRRELLVNLPGFKVLHLSLRPGQSMPVHNHPNCHVTIQGLVGTATVQLDGEQVEVPARSLLSFPGESLVSPGNTGTEECAVLISLVDRPAS